MRELGGYFGFEQLIKNEYYNDLVRLNTARNALIYLIKAKKISKIYIPDYLCDSVSDILNNHNFEYEYYNINSDFTPIFNGTIKDNEYLYVVNYFGQISNEKILLLKQKYKNIIIDNTHAFFQKPLSGVDTLYSCRKFFGVPDGAYLSTEKNLNEPLEIDVSKQRMNHILGRFEGVASDYYTEFLEADYLLNKEPLKQMSKLTQNLLGAIDYEEIRQIRNTNFAYLERELKEKNRLKLITPNGAFAYPFYIENGIEFREILIKKKIYIPILWPNVLETNLENNLGYQYAANILPLPCDQRYGIEEMKYIINCINDVCEYLEN